MFKVYAEQENRPLLLSVYSTFAEATHALPVWRDHYRKVWIETV